MNPPDNKNHPTKYLEMCQHSAIQALKPNTINTDGLWLPTVEQLHELLNEKLPYPERSSFRCTANGWEYETYFREWAADYDTYIDTYRQFVGHEAEVVLLKVLMALLGIDRRWMV